MTFNLTDIQVFIEAPGGKFWDLSKWACDNLTFSTKSPMGDDKASIMVEYNSADGNSLGVIPQGGGSGIPPRFSKLRVHDVALGADIWSGLISRRNITDWDGCNGHLNIEAEGLGNLLTWRCFQEETIYGPRPIQSTSGSSPSNPTGQLPNTNPAQSYAARDVIIDAVTRLGQGLIFPDLNNIEFLGDLVDATSDFFLRTPLDVINEICGLFSYLSTPLVWFVTTGLFSLKTRPSLNDIDYVINFGGKIIKMNLDDDGNAIYNEIIASWGKNQGGATAPDANTPYGQVIDYSQIPYIRDKGINLSSEVDSLAMAKQVVQGVYTRVHELNPGWSFSADVPTVSIIQSHIDGTIPPWRLRAGRQVRFDGLNPNQVFGDGNNPPPDYGYITATTWSGKNQATTITCGDKTDIVTAVRKINHKSNNISSAINNASLSPSKADASKTKKIGPKIDTSTPPVDGTNGATRQSYGTVAYDKKNDTLHPEVLPYQPMAPQVKYKSFDIVQNVVQPLGQGSAGNRFAKPVDPANPLQPDPAGAPWHDGGPLFVSGVSIPLGHITAWSVTTDKLCTCSIKFYKGSLTMDKLTDTALLFPDGEEPSTTATASNYKALSSDAYINVLPDTLVGTTNQEPPHESYYTAVLWTNDLATEITVTLTVERKYRDSISKKLGA